jgi:beta-galactosidase/beta-glucuronidase
MEHDVEFRIIGASDVEACVEVHYIANNAGSAELTGTISGPRVEGSRTLPATIALRPIAHAELPGAEAILPDPCYWSPERPFLYDVTLELRRKDQVVDSATFSIALHRKRVVKQ